jgi:hypothetical protein
MPGGRDTDITRPSYLIRTFDPTDYVSTANLKYGNIQAAFDQGCPISYAISQAISLGVDPNTAATNVNKALIPYESAIRMFGQPGVWRIITGRKGVWAFIEPQQYMDTSRGDIEPSIASNLSAEMEELMIGNEFVSIGLDDVLHALEQQTQFGPYGPDNIPKGICGVYGWFNGCLVMQFYPLDGAREERLLGESFMYLFGEVAAFRDQITKTAISEATRTGLPIGTFDYISPAPITSGDDKVAMAKGSYFSLAGAYPRWLVCFIHANMEGLPGILPVSQGGIPIPLNIQNLTPAQVGDNPIIKMPPILGANRDCYKRTLQLMACRTAGWRALCNDLKPTMDEYQIVYPEPGAQDANGNPTSSKFAAPLLAVKDPTTGTYLYPMFNDASCWDDLEASVNEGNCTEQQVQNLANDFIVSDPALADELLYHPQSKVVAFWNNTNKNAKYMLTLAAALGAQ